MKNLLIKWLDWLIQKDKSPKVFFICDGLSQDGRVKFEMFWNDAFITNMKANGIQGTTEEETAMLFLVGSQLRPEEMGLAEESVESEAHPVLTSESNYIKRG